MRTKKTTIAELKPDTLNANDGNEFGSALLEKSITLDGFGRSLLIDRDGNVIAGNKTLEAASAAGLSDVVIVPSDGRTIIAVQRTDLDAKSERGLRMAVADNRIGQLNLKWNVDNLAKIGEIVDLDQFKFDELEAFTLEDDQRTATESDDEAGTPPPDPETKVGEVWQLGENLIACVDSTDVDSVRRVLAGQRAQLIFTDPPYDLAGRARKIGVNELRGKSYGELYAAEWDQGFDITRIAPVLDAVADVDSSIYVCTSHFYLPELIPMFERLFDYSNVCVWAKSNPMPSLSKRHWCWSHEFVVYGTRGKHTFNYPPTGNALSVWSIAKNPRNEHHPTQKPNAIPAHAIEHSSRPGDLVVDLFSGSGSTLLACVDNARRFVGFEVDPAHVDTIKARYEAHTGIVPVRVADGEG